MAEEGSREGWRRRAVLATAAAGLASLAGCGGGADRTKANLRFVNASAYGALDLYVDGVQRVSSSAYGAASSYLEIDPDETESRLTRAGSTSALLSVTPTLVRKQFYTLVGWGREGRLKTVLLDDNADAADAGKVKLRVLNAAADAGELDLYLTAEGDSLTDAVPLVSGAKVGEAGSFLSVSAGSTWRLRATGAGTRSDLRLDLRGVSLPSGSVQTLVLTPAAGGVLVDALLLVQKGTVTARAVEHARVRVAAALPLGESVSVTADSQTLLSSIASPAIGAYQWVPAGARSVVVTGGASVLPTVTVTLAPGGEYTLLVHAAGGTPTSSWLSEDNRRPDSSAAARVRLVNGVSGSGSALALTSDALPVASGVIPGTGSDGVEVTAGDRVLAVREPGAADPLHSQTHTLTAAKLYTVFVLGGPTPLVLLREDR